MPIDPETGKRTRGRPRNEERAARDAQKNEILAMEPTDTVVLPFGYKILVFAEEEFEDVTRDARSWIERQNQIDPGDWSQIHMLLENQLAWRRLHAQVVRMQANPRTDQKELAELLRREEKLQAQIQTSSKLLDKRQDDDDTSASAVIQDYINANLEYLSENVGEYTWRCPHCGGYSICEVPHLAVDPAFGPGAIWNGELYAMVAHYYGWRNRLKDVMATLPAEIVEQYLAPGTPLGELLDDAKGLPAIEAAEILRIAPVGIFGLAYERDYELNVPYDIDKPDTLVPYVLTPEEQEEWWKDAGTRERLTAEKISGGLPSPKAVFANEETNDENP